MTITRIEIYQCPIRLHEPFVISLGPMTHAENVLVVITTDTGMKGFGECSPFLTINGEAMDSAAMMGRYLGRALKGKDPLDIADCEAAMDRVVYGNYSIKSAFDIALYDIASQHAGVPLYAFLGGDGSKVMYTDYTVGLGSPEKMAVDAGLILERGFRFVKVKLGESPDDDLARIHAIRERIGMDTPLCIDANQGWGVEEAIACLRSLDPYNIHYCEEPIPRWLYTELPRVRTASPIPLMADESLSDHHDAKRLIDLEACQLFNLKLGKSGGIFKALKIIELAERAGIGMQVGGFLESRLAFTASAHLATISKHIRHFDFDSPLMIEEDPVGGGITYGENGLVSLPDTPGLGAWVHEEFLRELVRVVVE